MNKLKTAFAIALAALLSMAAVAPVSAARVYNFETNTWEEPSVATSRGRRGSSIPRKLIDYETNLKVGTIVIETSERRLYFVLPEGKAMVYGVGVGRDGFRWSGVHRVTAKKEWPDWTPPPQMLRRRPDLPRHMKGGEDNPLGARAMYLGSTLYRIHGSNEPETIGQAVSSGCFRMTNADVIDLYERVQIGATVIVKN